eukprot:gene14068-15534_t
MERKRIALFKRSDDRLRPTLSKPLDPSFLEIDAEDVSLSFVPLQDEGDPKDQYFYGPRQSPLSFYKSGKRKSNSLESNLSPSRKQHITEEKMAACMQMLSLRTDNSTVAVGSVKQINDDSDFEDDSDLEDEINSEQSRRHPTFELHSDFKKSFPKPAALLPERILDNIRGSSPCLALVPYDPPNDFVQKVFKEKIAEIKESEEMDDRFPEPVKMEENEYFELDWDTDSDNDLVLD